MLATVLLLIFYRAGKNIMAPKKWRDNVLLGSSSKELNSFIFNFIKQQGKYTSSVDYVIMFRS